MKIKASNRILLPAVVVTLFCGLLLPVYADDDIPNSLARKFNFAIGLYKEAIYDAAIDEFEQFLEKYPESPISDDSLFWLAMSYWKNGNIDKAIEKFNDYITRYPAEKHTEFAISYLGLIYFENNMIDQGVEIVKVLLDKYPDNVQVADALFNCGMRLYSDNRPAEALSIFAILEKIKVTREFKAKVKYYQGLVYLKQKKYDAVVAKMNEITDVAPADSTVLASAVFLLGEVKYNQKDYPAAIQYYEQIVRDYPGEALVIPGVYYSLGWSYSQLKNYPAAIEKFLRLYQEFPDDKNVPQSLFRAAILLMQTGKLDEAMTALEDLIVKYEESPLLPEAYYNLGYLYYNKGDFLTANNIFLKLYAISREKNQDYEKRSLYMLSESYYKLREYYKAIQYTSLYLDKYTDDPQFYTKTLMTRAWSYKEVDSYDSALADYQVIVDRETGDLRAESLFRIGEIFYNRKKYMTAKDFLTRVIELYPASPFVEHALYARGLSYVKLKNFSNCIGDFQQLVDSYPATRYRDEAFMNAGWAQFRSERYADAVKYFEQVSDQNAEYLQAVYQIAECYFNDREYDTAIGYYQKIIDADPNTPLSDDASYGIGISYLHKRSYDRGLAILEEFINKFPASDLVENVRMVLGDHFTSLQQYDSAVFHYSKIISSKKGDRLKEETYLKMGQLYQLRREFETAIGYYDSVISLGGLLRARAVLLKGLLYKEMNQYPEAINQFRMLTEHRLDESLLQRAYYEMGFLYGSQAKWDLAAASYRHAIAREGAYKAEALHGLGMVYFIMEDYDTAVACYLEAIDYGNDEVAGRAQYWLGQTYYARKNYTQAIRELLKIFILYPGSEYGNGALMKIAESYQMLDDYEQSIAYYERVIREFKDTPESAEARERIEWIKQVSKDLKKIGKGDTKK